MTTIRADAHKPEFHRASPPQLPVRVASTANVTIATALNVGDSIDGVTLADGDRVLLKNQSTGAENGVYVAGATPERAFDMLEGVAAYGAVIYVVAGTANGGHTFANTNTTVPTIDTDALTFTDYSPTSGGAPTTADYLVGTTQAGLSAEIVVGTTPGGELGGTWASPTVDPTHSGTAHTDFIAKSVLTTQDDIIVRDASAPARLAKGSDGQVLTVDPTTHHLVWATPTAGGIAGIGVKEAGSTVVATATALDFLNPGFDVTSPGGGVAAVAFDPSEIALDTLGATTDITTLNSTTGAHGLLRKLDASVVNFLRGDGAWADPSIAPSGGSAFFAPAYGDGSDGNVTISVDTNLVKDMFYNDLTINSGVTLSTLLLKVFVKGTLTLNGTIACNGNNGGNGGTGTAGAGGAAGAAGTQQTGGGTQTLPNGAAGRAGTIGGFNSNGLNGSNASQSTFGVNVPAATNGGISGSGRNGGVGGSATTGAVTEGDRPYYWPRIIQWRNETGTSYNMNTVSGQTSGAGSGGGAALSGGGGSGGGGSSGGFVIVCAKAITGNGVIRAKGGNGGNGGNGLAAAQAGGGSAGNGGQGGVIVLVYGDNSGWTGTLDVAGGTKGTKGNAGGGAGSTDGGIGNDGNAGLTFTFRIA